MSTPAEREKMLAEMTRAERRSCSAGLCATSVTFPGHRKQAWPCPRIVRDLGDISRVSRAWRMLWVVCLVSLVLAYRCDCSNKHAGWELVTLICCVIIQP